MNKAFFINGGAGRVLCSIPGLERYAETHDDFVIIAESWGDLYMNCPTLRDKCYPTHHKGLFEEKLKDKEIISPEPYRLNAYFNQKCNLIQAFDMMINDLDEIPETRPLKLDLTKADQVIGYNIVQEVKEKLKKEKTIVIQPFGSTVKAEGRFIIDPSGRSFELANIQAIIDKLKDFYNIIVMSDVSIPGIENSGVAWPQGVSLNAWAGIINAADYFLGCDSVVQHLAHALGKPATVVIGATFPENISYPDNKNFKIVDLGEGRRKYSPIRMSFEDAIDRDNEALMLMKEAKQIDAIVEGIKKKLGKPKKNLIGTIPPTMKGADINVNGDLLGQGSKFKGFADKQIKKSARKNAVERVLEMNDVN